MYENLKIPEHVTWKGMESGSVLLDINTSNYYTLNETATRVWRGIVEGSDIDTIVEGVMSEFDIGKGQCAADVCEQICFLIKEGLLHQDTGSNGS